MGLDILDLVRREAPVELDHFPLPHDKGVGLVIVDEVNGFCSVGCGSLAPLSHDQQIFHMVEETDKVAKEFSARGWPMLVLLDTHDANKPEPPYPPHCIKGSGEDQLVPALRWLECDKNAFIMPKDCIDGYIGGLQEDGTNRVADWVKKNSIKVMVVVGICTDICVLDFVLTALSARNHGVLAPLEEVVVYSEGCSTFNLPREVAEKMGGVVPHPQGLTHHMGLYFAKSRGARVVDNIIFPNFVSPSAI